MFWGIWLLFFSSHLGSSYDGVKNKQLSDIWSPALAEIYITYLEWENKFFFI